LVNQIESDDQGLPSIMDKAPSVLSSLTQFTLRNMFNKLN